MKMWSFLNQKYVTLIPILNIAYYPVPKWNHVTFLFKMSSILPLLPVIITQCCLAILLSWLNITGWSWTVEPQFLVLIKSFRRTNKCSYSYKWPQVWVRIVYTILVIFYVYGITSPCNQCDVDRNVSYIFMPRRTLLLITVIPSGDIELAWW